MSEDLEQDKGGLQLECPSVDSRAVFIAILAVFCIIIFIVASEKGGTVPFSAKVIFGLCAVFVAMSFRKAGKNVFSLNDDHIALLNGTKIPYKKIDNVLIANGVAQFVFTDDNGNEKNWLLCLGKSKSSSGNMPMKFLRPICGSMVLEYTRTKPRNVPLKKTPETANSRHDD